MNEKRGTINRLEETQKRETRAWVLAGFVLFQIAEDSRKAHESTRRLIEGVRPLGV